MRRLFAIRINLIAISLLASLLVGCERGPLSPEEKIAKEKAEEERVEALIKGQTSRFDFEGHTYILRTWSNYGTNSGHGYAGMVHDPDCECHGED